MGRTSGWREHCPKKELDKWVVFHAACVNHYRERQDFEYDEGIQKQNIMLMIWDLVKPESTADMLGTVMTAIERSR